MSDQPPFPPPAGASPAPRTARPRPDWSARRRRAAATLALAALAVAGTHFHVSLFFGVDLIFGSAAALLALVWLGTLPGLLVAAAGAAWTLVLWDHPYALVILVAEVGGVAWFLRRAGAAGAPPPLLVADAWYWLLVGMPLVLLFYQQVLGMDWRPTLLVALKQALNGILNAGLATGLLLALALWRRRPASLLARRALFNLLLGCMLLPGVSIVVWENHDLKTRLEADLAQRIGLFGALVVEGLADAGVGSGDPALPGLLARRTALLAPWLPAGAVPRVAVISGPATWADAAPGALPAPLPGAPPTRLSTGHPTLQLVPPDGRQPARMLQWRAAHYRLRLPLRPTPAPAAEPVEYLLIELPAAVVIDPLQARITRQFAMLLGLSWLAMLAADWLSRRLVTPLERLTRAAADLPERILADRPVQLPATGMLVEHGALATSLTRMAEHLATGFRALKDSEARLNEAQATARLGSWDWDVASGALRWSDETYRLFGYAPQAVAPDLALFYGHVVPADRPRVAAAVDEAMCRPDGRYGIEHRIIAADGTERVIRESGRVHFDAAGQPLRVSGTCLDITHQRAIEDALCEQRERYRLVVEHAEDLIVRTSADGRFEFVSPSYCALFGRREDELLGQSFLPLVHPDDQGSTAAAVAQLFHPPYRCRIEQRAQTIYGWRWLQWVDRAVLNDQGEVVGIIAIGRDIQPRKEAELDLQQREALERELLMLAAELVSLPDGGLDAAIDRSLATLGGFTDSDRAYLFLIDDDAATSISNTHEWVATGVAPMREHLQHQPVEGFLQAHARLSRGEPVVIPRVADLAEDWASLRAVLSMQSIQSVLLVPLHQHGRWVGLLGFDSVHAERTWSAAEVRFLRVFANILVSAREREQGYGALRESHARFDQLARQSRAVAWAVDADARYTYVSPVCEAVWGYTPEQLLGRTAFELLMPGPAGAEVEARARAVVAAKGSFSGFLNAVRHADGHPVWVLTNAAPILAPDGDLLGYQGLDIDINEQYQAQQRLRASEARLAAIFDSAPIGIALIGPDLHIAQANQALARFLGRRTTDLIGARVEDFTHPGDMAADQALLAELLAGTRDSYRLTKRYRHADGRVIWGDLRVALLPPATPGGLPTPLGMVEDITDFQAETARREALEQALAEYRTHLEALVDLSSQSLAPAAELDALLRFGCDGLGLAAAMLAEVEDADGSPRLLALADGGPTAAPEAGDAPPAAPMPAADRLAVERPATDGLASDLLTPDLLTPDLLQQVREQPGRPVVLDRQRLPAAVSAAGYGCGIAIGQRWRGLDGREHQLVMVFWGDGECTAFGGLDRELVRLIGQRVGAVCFEAQLQQDLVAARERAAIGHLASGIAHDFNNLLGVIDANLYYLRQTAFARAPDRPGLAAGAAGAVAADDELAEVLDEIDSALGQAKVISTGILALSRAGGIPLEPVDLGASIGALARILRHVLPPEIELVLDCAPDLYARTNAGFLQSSVLNLALNARDAMPRGGRLRIATRPAVWDGREALAVGTLPPGPIAEVSVTDSGGGIAPAVMARLFEPLFSTKARQRGHGLGLFMVHEFIAHAGAGLAVRSTVGVGTEFRLLLPPTAAGAAARAEAGADAGTGAADLPPQRTAPRVLLVDDDPRVRDALGRLLGLLGVAWQQAEHGGAALAALAADAGFDLVLSDIAMPVLDGPGLCRALAGSHPGLPVVLMSGQDAAPAEHLPGAPLVLRKPVELPALQQALAQHGLAVPGLPVG